MARVEFQGKDLEEAIAQAAEALSLPPEKVKFSVVTMGGKGFLGFGKRKARISVDPDDPSLDIEEEARPAKAKGRAGEPESPRPSADGEAREANPVGSGRAGSDRPAEGGDKGGGLKRSSPSDRPERPEKEERGRRQGEAGRQQPRAVDASGGASRRRGCDDSPSGSAGTRSEQFKSKAQRPDDKAGEEIKALNWEHVPPPLTRPAPGESVEPADAAALEAAAVVEEIIKRMGFSAEIKAGRIGSRIILSLESEDNAILIGGRGGTLEALQLLSGKIMARKNREKAEGAAREASGPPAAREGEDLRVVVDAADYRFRRQENLLENLKNLAEQARRSQKPQIMSGLSSADRRLVQIALRPFKDLTASHAAGGRDSLTIAVAQPQAASRPARGRRRPHGGHQKQ